MSSRSIVSASSRSLRRLALWITLGVCLVAGAGTATAAKRRIVVIDFGGTQASKFQRDVESVLEKKHSVVPGDKYDATAKKLGATKPTAKNVAKVARRLNTDGVLIGFVKRKGARYELTLQLREGKSGEFVATVKVRARKAKLSASEQRTLKSELLAAIDDLPAVSDEGDDDDDDDVAEGDDDDDDDDDDDVVAKGKGKGKDKGGKGKGKDKGSNRKTFGDDDDDDDDVADDDDDDDDVASGDDDDDDADDDDDDDEKRVAALGEDDDDEVIREDDRRDSGGDSGGALVTDAQRADMAVRGRGLDIAGGVSVIGRRLSFSVSEALENAPQGYRGSPVAGAYLTADLFPLAFSDKNTSITRNLGITGTIEQVLKIESRLIYTDDTSGMEVEAVLPTTQARYGVGVVYRHNFGDSPTSPTLKAFIRYNKMKFSIDKAGVPADKVDIPNTDYTFIDPGLGLRYPFSLKTALLLEGRFLLITDTGEMQQPEQYGSASVTGAEGDASIEYKVNPQLFVRVGGRFMSIGFAFDGNGALTTGRDGDDTTIDVGGARDTYYGGYGVAGYLF
jgi:hypothetical protein